MEQYVDYNYYQNDYLKGKEGVVDATSFDFLAVKATQLLKKRTLGNSEWCKDTDEVKACTCAIIESLNEESQSESKLKSESVGEHSVSYETKSAKQYQKDRETIFGLYLWELGILDRRVY